MCWSVAENKSVLTASPSAVKPSMPETTALGAAMAAGAAEGVSVWSLNPEDLSEVTSEKFEPQINPEGANMDSLLFVCYSLPYSHMWISKCIFLAM